MTDSQGRIYRCSNCGAPLSQDKADKEFFRCLFCGVDNEIVREAASASEEVRGHTRMSTLVLPYLFGPMIGFASILVLRDFVGSPYFGRPALLVAFLFLVLGLSGLRIPASLGLLVIGAINIAKAALYPIPEDYLAQYKRFTSDTGFEYLLPGIAYCFLGLLFFASIRLVALNPSLRALKIRVGVLLLTLLAAGYSYFSLGQSSVKYADQFRGELTHLLAMSESVCSAQLAEDLTQTIEPLPIYSHAVNDKGSSTVLFVSCAALDAVRSKDSLHIDSLHNYQSIRSGASRYHYRSVGEIQKTSFSRLQKARYAVAYLENEESFSMVFFDLKTEKVLRKFLIPNTHDYTTQMAVLWGAMEEATGGTFPIEKAKGSLASPTSRVKQTKTSFMAQPARPSLEAEFIYHSNNLGLEGKRWMYGFAYNKSKVEGEEGEITAVFSDSVGKVVTKKKGRTFGPMRPGKRTLVAMPIDYSISENTAFEVRVQPLGARVFSDGLSVSGLTKPTLSSGIMRVEGEVENSSVDALSVRVHILFFDANDKLIFARPALVDQTSIPRGGSSHFKLLSKWPDGLTFSRIESEVVGIEQL